jgi:hypothetical protein
MTSNRPVKYKHPGVLADHKRVGKKFIPPFLHLIGPLSEVSWVNELIPQLIWIALLLDSHGHSRGVELALDVSKCASSPGGSNWREFFAWMSSFQNLSTERQQSILSSLAESGTLPDVRSAFLDFQSLYPNSPLAFLEAQSSSASIHSPERIKAVLAELYNRRSILATHVQATVVYLAFAGGWFKVANNTSLADFPEVEHYPDTEKSRQVAASVRATVNAFYGHLKSQESPEWPHKFWNRGLVLEPCCGLTESQNG